MDAEEALRSLSDCLQAGWEPTTATCSRCGQAIVDVGAAARLPAREHRCWSCNYKVTTAHKAVVNPLAVLEPRRKLLGSGWGITLGFESVGFLGALGGSSSVAATAATSAQERAADAPVTTCTTCKEAIMDGGVNCQGCSNTHHATCARPATDEKLPFTCGSCLAVAKKLHIRDVTLD